MKSTDLWDVMQCSSERVRSFGGTYRLHFQGGIIVHTRKQKLPLAACLCNWYLASSTLKLKVMGLSEISGPVQTVRRYSTERCTGDYLQFALFNS
jgi:hypothetical protein